MYPVSLGYSEAINRIQKLLTNGHDAEALVTTAFTVEKTLRRTLRQLIVSAGFTSSAANRLVRNLRGLEAVEGNWDIYDPCQRKLSELVEQSDWTQFKQDFRQYVAATDVTSCNK